MKKLSDYTIISDVDGTLLTYDGVLPQRNVDAIQRFTQAGGRFGIATGRSRGLMLDAVEKGMVPINAPCVLYNGGALYDKQEDKMLMELFLTDKAEGYLREIVEFFDHIGVLIISGDTYHQVKEELDFANYFTTRAQENFHVSQMDQVKQPWYKVLFQVREEDYQRFFQMVGERSYPGVRFVGTNFTLIEMLPEESSKGYALEKLIEMNLVERENLVAIGDFYNDLEMIQLAGIGVTLKGAPQDIQDVADLVVGDCAGGAVADVIEHLERLCGQ